MRDDSLHRPRVARRMPLRVVCIATIWTFVSGATSCSTDGSGGDGPAVGGPTFVTDVVLKDAAGNVSQRFAPGEPITLELTVRNRTQTEVVVQFPSGQHFDWVVVDAGSSRVRWRWSHDRAFIQILTQTVFLPEQTKTFSATWNQLDNDGQLVNTGSYEARGVMVFPQFANDPLAEHELGSPLRAFTIQ